MKNFFILLFLFALIMSCTGEPMRPKPKSMLNLKYPNPSYITKKSRRPFSLKINSFSTFVNSGKCNYEIIYPNLKGTIYLTYRKVNNNFDSLCDVLTKLDSEDLNFLWNKQYKDIREYDLKENMKKFILLYSNL